jgi:tetratricopeptide (TPR) repeat protein
MGVALIIGVGRYDREDFPALSAAAQDVDALTEALRHPQIGGSRASEVMSLQHPTLAELRSAIEALCSNRKPDDRVLVYFSGYGVVDDHGQLFLPCRNSDLERLSETAYAMTELHSCLEVCRSQQQVVILDCCFRGSFAKGMVSLADTDAIGQQMGSKRRAFLTSPWSLEYSFKHKSGERSLYTQYLLNGLETGMADGSAHQAIDGEISATELHDYLRVRLEEDYPSMFPKIYSVGEGYNIAISHAPYLEFRREAIGLAIRGEISPVGQKILEELRLKSGIDPETAKRIRKDVLLPYQHQLKKRREYEQLQADITRVEMPLSDNTKAELRQLRELYELEEDPAARSQTPPVTQAPIEPDTNLNSNTVIETPDSTPDEPVSQDSGFRQRLRSLVTPLGHGSSTQDSETGISRSRLREILRDQDLSPRFLQLLAAGLGVLALLALVFWLAFQPPERSAQLTNDTEWFREGLKRSKDGNHRRAIEAYTKAIDLAPNNPNFYYNRGIEFKRAGDLDRAIGDYNLAIQFDSAFADAYFNRANIWATRGDREAAIKDYQAAARLYRQQGKTELQQDAQNAVRSLQGQP